MTMPPAPKPTHASEVAKAGTDRMPPDSAAIDLSATTVIQGAPTESARITSTMVATIQELPVSMVFIGSCIWQATSRHRYHGRHRVARSRGWGQGCGQSGSVPVDRLLNNCAR